MTLTNPAVTGRHRPLKLGLCLDTLGLTSEGAFPSWSDFVALAQRAEAVGFDSLWLPDHLLFRWPSGTTGAWECWSLLAALAVATHQMELGTIVSCTGFRNPALLAKMAVAVDDISGGRLILGIGAGRHGPEYAAFGYPYDHRVSRFEEAFTIIRTLLREGRVDFAARYYQARSASCCRAPRALAGPPIMVGTTAGRMLHATAAHADLWNGWLLTERNDPALVPPLRERLDLACAAVGRDPATLTRTIGIAIGSGEVFRTGPPPSGGTQTRSLTRCEHRDRGNRPRPSRAAPTTLAAVEAFAPVLRTP